MIIRRYGLLGGYRSLYPPAQNGTYVLATSESDASHHVYCCTDPTKSLTGAATDVSWASAHSTTPNNRLHIDLGTVKVIARIYYENYHSSGGSTTSGAKDFTLWGSNTAAAFADTTYATDTNWTQLTLSSSTFLEHVALDQADPHYINVTPSSGYRYYAVKMSSGYEHYNGLRRIELQEMY